jgi:hypothetical protein
MPQSGAADPLVMSRQLVTTKLRGSRRTFTTEDAEADPTQRSRSPRCRRRFSASLCPPWLRFQTLVRPQRPGIRTLRLTRRQPEFHELVSNRVMLRQRGSRLRFVRCAMLIPSARQFCFCAILLTAIPTAVAAQDKPDFSGRWVLVSSRTPDPSAAQMLTVRQTVTRTNVRGGPMQPFFSALIVERQFADRAATATYQIGAQGGMVGGIVGGGVAETRHSVRWEGNRLVIETGSYSGPARSDGPYSERTEEWQLDAAGRLVLLVTERRSGALEASNTLTYQKN